MISTHVPSLELCKKLRDLGWKKETMFWWVRVIGYDSNIFDVVFNSGNIWYGDVETIPAPTVGEMMEVIPEGFSIRKEHKMYFCGSFIQPYIFKDTSAVNCVATLLIDLLLNNLVKLEEKE